MITKKELLEKVEETQPQNITVDLIRELRRRGFHDEANSMLNKYRDCIEDTKKNITKEIRRIDDKIRRFSKKKNNLCVRYGCYENMVKCGYCEKHYEQEKAYGKKCRMNKKSKSKGDKQ